MLGKLTFPGFIIARGVILSMSNKRSFRLFRPTCPSCEGEDVGVVCSFGNYMRIVFDIILGLFFYTPFSYNMLCKKCGRQFNVDPAET